MLAVADPADLDQGPRTKSGVERMCAVTRQVASVDNLIRYVASPSGEVIPDLKRKLPGRGLWISLSHSAVAEAAKRGVFAKSFKRELKVSRTLADDTDRLIVRSLIDALAMAGKAGQVVSGFAKVEAAIDGRQAVALIHATDGAPDGIRKLNAKFGGAVTPNAPDSAGFPVVSVLTKDELDLALGRANVVHAALLAGPASKTFLTRCQMLIRYRMTAGDKVSGAIRNET
ncbi:MAG: RNA-binding protein [Pseudomonadota bacterium]